MNEVKVIEPELETPEPKEVPNPSVAKSQKSKQKPSEKFLLFKREDAAKWLPFTLFLFVMVVVYISVQQYAERTVRNTEKINKEINELRSEYLSTKAELMKESMQTDLAKKLEGSGLKELMQPAIKLKLEKPKLEEKK